MTAGRWKTSRMPAQYNKPHVGRRCDGQVPPGMRGVSLTILKSEKLDNRLQRNYLPHQVPSSC